MYDEEMPLTISVALFLNELIILLSEKYRSMTLNFTWKEARTTDKILKDILPEATSDDAKYYLDQIGLVW